MNILNNVDGVKVQFLKPIFEGDFPERGMKAWLTATVYDEKHECYKLFFDFTEFESENDKYLQESYYPNNTTAKLKLDKPSYTAKEAGYYENKYSVYCSIKSGVRNDVEFNEEILEYLKFDVEK